MCACVCVCVCVCRPNFLILTFRSEEQTSPPWSENWNLYPYTSRGSDKTNPLAVFLGRGSVVIPGWHLHFCVMEQWSVTVRGTDFEFWVQSLTPLTLGFMTESKIFNSPGFQFSSNRNDTGVHFMDVLLLVLAPVVSEVKKFPPYPFICWESWRHMHTPLFLNIFCTMSLCHLALVICYLNSFLFVLTPWVKGHIELV
jgi:hypothetical protein